MNTSYHLLLIFCLPLFFFYLVSSVLYIFLECESVIDLETENECAGFCVQSKREGRKKEGERIADQLEMIIRSDEKKKEGKKGIGF